MQLTLATSAADATGALTVWASGTSRPHTVAAQYAPKTHAGSTAIVRLGRSGRVALHASRGAVHVDITVTGWFSGGPATTAGAFVASAPRRITAHVPAHGTTGLQLAGRAGITSRTGLVAASLTVAGPARSGAVTAYESGQDRPSRPTVQFTAHRSATQLALVRLAGGHLSLHNGSAARVTVELDVVGHIVAGQVTAAGGLQLYAPGRPTTTPVTVGASTARTIHLGSGTFLPLAHLRAVLVTATLTATRDSAATLSSPGRRGTSVPLAAGRPTTVTALAAVSGAGALVVRHAGSGTLHVAVEIAGYVADRTLAPPAVSRSRYLSDVDGLDAASDAATMNADGCADATAGSRLVLLDVGAQSVTGPQLSAADPGVALAEHTGPTVRLTYAQLVDAISAYLTGFARCADRPATIAVGTNNSGAFTGPTAYPAPARGTAWGADVVNPLRAAAPSGLTVVGAVDLEAGGDFDTVEANAQQWETAYLAATPARLINNGSANGCPTSWAAAATATCAHGWTLAQYYALSHSGSRIEVLPQSYTVLQPVQWAAIDRAGGGRLIFAGALTEHAVDGETLTPADAWTALRHALSTVVAAPSLPAVTDLGG